MTASAASLLVAHVHDGRVLVDETGTLPSFARAEGESKLRTALGLTGADVLLAPVVKLADGRFLHVVGSRGPVRVERFRPPATLADPELAAAVEQAVAELDPANTPQLRPAWFRPGWFDRVEAWVDEVLASSGRRRTAPVVATKLWSISAVVRVPTDGRDLWLKAACEHFRAEARVHASVARLFPDLVPTLIAVEENEGWLLMEPLAGAEDEDRADGATLEAATRWAGAQLEAVAHVDDLVEGGCASRGVEESLDRFHEVLAASSELPLLSEAELAEVRGCAAEIDVLVREFWSTGLPDTLAHGDLHIGNIAWDGNELRIFDWTDGCVSHPFLDATHLAHNWYDGSHDTRLEAAYATPWRASYPDVDIDRVLTLAPLVNSVFQAVTFDGIVNATEQQSRWELGGVVADFLRSLPEKVAALR